MIRMIPRLLGPEIRIGRLSMALIRLQEGLLKSLTSVARRRTGAPIVGTRLMMRELRGPETAARATLRSCMSQMCSRAVMSHDRPLPRPLGTSYDLRTPRGLNGLLAG